MKKVLVITMLIILLFTFKSNLLSIEPIWEKQYDVKGIEFYQGPDALLQTSDGCYVFASICSTKPELGNKYVFIPYYFRKETSIYFKASCVYFCQVLCLPFICFIFSNPVY